MPESMFEGEGYVNIFSFDLVIEGSHLTNEKKSPRKTLYKQAVESVSLYGLVRPLYGP